MSKKAALGKGLNALLPSLPQEGELPAEGGAETPRSRLYHFEDRLRLLGRVAEIEVDQIRPNPYQPRRDFDDATLEELAASIRQLGIIQPITVRALGDSKFEVISGERRLRAARRAGLKRLPAYVRDADTEEMLEMALVENIQREDLNPIEVALSYQRLIEEVGLTQEAIAQKVGKNRTTITNFLRLLKLPPRVQSYVRDGTISSGHARMLVSIEDEEVQLQLLGEILEKELTVRDVERWVREWHHRPEPADETREDATDEPPLPNVPLFTVPDADALQIQSFGDRLRTRLSTQVNIRHRPNGSGRIEIAYYSNDDLERLLELITGR